MKVLLALHDYLPRHAGGSEIHAHQVARELVRRGHEVAACFTERDLDSEEGDVRSGELEGVRTIEVVHQREYADVRETWKQERALARFREVLAEERPDAVHVHHLSLLGTGAVAAAREAGARVAVTLHDFHAACDAAVLLRRDLSLCEDGPRGACTDCLRRHPLLPERWGGQPPEEAWAVAARERLESHRAALSLADRLIAPSRFLAGLFLEAGLAEPERLEVLPYGAPGPRRPPRASDPREPLRVGFTGGIYPSKGVHVLVEAFRRLDGVSARLEVHGHLDWFPEYAERVRAASEGLPVRFAGGFPPGGADRVLGSIDVLCVPSLWYENLPLTIQDAFRCSVPVVATDLGGMRESVADGVSGLLFPRGDAGALAERLSRLARDRDLLHRLARGTPEPARLEYVVDRLEEVYAGAPAP